MFQRILIAWDGSAPARLALDIALDLGRRYEAEVVALAVAYSPAHAETEEDRAESVSGAKAYLEETFARVRDRAERIGVPLEFRVIEGERPAEAIAAHADDAGFDLIVAGHHRAGRRGRFLLVGVAERLIAAARVPVLIIGDDALD
jgi:nucleotide-binding universal stress UspA family protein